MKSNTYTISDLAREYDITPRTIRFYEDQGLLTPSREGRQRVFSEGDNVRLRLILRGKRLGFSLSEAKEIIELYGVESGGERQLTYLLEKIEQRRVNLKQQQEDIKSMLLELKSVEKRVRAALKEMQSK
ncbi:MAG: MerR family DNA-binding transcriptional regulator [Gammaproteobacteria bacterium]|nr:MerR family DNA-binding transcriptional regulator [Gammaproteobacteria bacterium]MCP5406899.1 MerR family DNA-binding transcriptional regulator [Chromatiaceae bacterium]MCP5408476.1 MerR family DNA-binding transcriptional regulator [Chromatiaceae bacterium]MCP5444889.1 MerR family DNA-binding transcriptional regulator [Chromatiaceae bacterium]